MNIILFTESEINKNLDINDYRAKHLLKILKCSVGDSFTVGLINGKKGSGIIKEINPNSINIEFNFNEETKKLYPIKLICGMCRPISVKRIIRDLSTLGIGEFIFSGTDTGEKSYISSKLWKNKEYEKYLRDGAEQAVSTHIPKLKTIYKIDNCLEFLNKNSQKIALDNYESTESLSIVKIDKTKEIILAIGSERGWSNRERNFFRDNNFIMADMGCRVLRTETACISAVSIILSKCAYI